MWLAWGRGILLLAEESEDLATGPWSDLLGAVKRPLQPLMPLFRLLFLVHHHRLLGRKFEFSQKTLANLFAI